MQKQPQNKMLAIFRFILKSSVANIDTCRSIRTYLLLNLKVSFQYLTCLISQKLVDIIECSLLFEIASSLGFYDSTLGVKGMLLTKSSDLTQKKFISLPVKFNRSFPGGSDGKEPACSAGDLSSIPGDSAFPQRMKRVSDFF